MKDDETFTPAGRKHWRQWLVKNHDKKQSIWLICYKKQTEVPTVLWSDAVDEALCFGWIDSIRRPLDDEKFIQYFSRRKPTSVWSKVNKDKVQRLIDEGQMEKAGYATIETAKKNGTWTLMDAVEKLTIPKQLAKEFKAEPGSKEFFQSVTKSTRKRMLAWIVMAKQEETKKKRIKEIVAMAGKGVVPKMFR
jgi:uncharacterized protein YdeI (YjbR/CyaY-like superfamily)